MEEMPNKIARYMTAYPNPLEKLIFCFPLPKPTTPGKRNPFEKGS